MKNKLEITKAVTDIITGIQERVAQAQKKQDADSYITLGSIVKETRNVCRESLQFLTRDQAKKIVEKLRKLEEITDEEMGIIRLWVVGDVDFYVREENDYQNWVNEAARLTKEIQKLQGREMDVKGLLELQALVTDLDRTTQDIAQFLSDKERVERFEKSTEILDGNEAQVLADMLSRKIASPDM